MVLLLFYYYYHWEGYSSIKIMRLKSYKIFFYVDSIQYIIYIAMVRSYLELSRTTYIQIHQY